MTDTVQDSLLNDSKVDFEIPRLPAELSKALFNHAADGLIVMNDQREILYMNETAIEMTGYDTAIGNQCGALFHCHDQRDDPLQLDGCFGNCVITSRQPVTNVEMNIISKSGNPIPVAVSYSSIPLADGRAYLLMSIRDISDLKRLQLEQRHKEELRYTMQERERLARDLHDGVVQDIAYANLQIKLMIDDMKDNKTLSKEQLENIGDVLEQSYTELRRAIYDLTFRVKDDLTEYVQKYLLEYKARNDVEVHLHAHHMPKKMEPFIASQLAKILQEALTNIRKHAQATRVDVYLMYAENSRTMLMTIVDDGTGFDPSVSRGDKHFGMKTMKERADLIGGDLQLLSELGKGTTIRIKIPMDADNQ